MITRYQQMIGFFIRKPRLSALETSRAKDLIVLFAYMGLAMFLPMTMLLRTGHSTPLIELMPAIVLTAFLTVAVATDHFQRSLRDRVMVVVGAMAWYFVFGLPFAELGFVDVARALHMDLGSEVSKELIARGIAGTAIVNVATSVSRWMLKGPRRSLDMQLI